MNDKYIEECKNWKWLQENFTNYESGKANNGRVYVEGYGLVNVPNLKQLIEMLGDEFRSLGVTKKGYACLVSVNEYKMVRVYADTPELAVLEALKKNQK